ncbi:hypothetical protein GCM10009086_26660 [Pseudomonas rhodesiae]
MLGSRLQPEVDRVKAHKRLTAFNALAGFDQPLKDLAGNPKAQIALHAGRHYPCE